MGRSGADTVMDGREGAVADGEPGTVCLEAAGVGGEAGLCCSVAHKSLLHGCGTGDELQMSCRVFRCFVKLPQLSGFPQKPQVIGVLVKFREFWMWLSELKLVVTEGL